MCALVSEVLHKCVTYSAHIYSLQVVTAGPLFKMRGEAGHLALYEEAGKRLHQ